MSIFDDYSSRTLSLSDILGVINNTSWETFDKGFLEGLFTGIDLMTSGDLTGYQIEKALDFLRDNTQDPMTSSEVERLREALEQKFKEENGLE